ncbi:MAG: endonuclease/exonuclease/phosphatase family protein [Actinomycetota bacterium]
MRVRVLVYNVRGFRDGADRVASVVDRFEPDLVLLNESGGRCRLRRFAKRVQMKVVGDPWSPFRRRVKDAVLVRAPWRVLDRRFRRFEGSARWYPRGANVVRVARSGYRLWVAAVHLGLRPAERRRHAEELADLLRGFDGPVIIGGDLNETPSGRAVSFLSERFWDAWLLGGDVTGETFPADQPTARIDYLFVSEGIRVERAIVPSIPEVGVASDHRPIVAELTLPDPD